MRCTEPLLPHREHLAPLVLIAQRLLQDVTRCYTCSYGDRKVVNFGRDRSVVGGPSHRQLVATKKMFAFGTTFLVAKRSTGVYVIKTLLSIRTSGYHVYPANHRPRCSASLARALIILDISRGVPPTAQCRAIRRGGRRRPRPHRHAP